MTYAFKRLIGAVPLLLIIITLAFILMRSVPGGPFDQDRNVPPEIEANLKAAYHLDKPLYVQYLNYLGGVIRGDLGPSFKYHDYSVSQLIKKGAPVSLRIGGLAVLVALILGISLGAMAAIYKSRLFDNIVMGMTMLFLAMPSFVIAPALSLLFAVVLKWLPVGGWGDTPKQYFLPIISLAIPQIAYITRLVRGAMLEVLQSRYILFAKARGLKAARIIWVHAIRPTMLPVVSYLGPATASILSGSIVIEQIFSIPGIGRYFIQGGLNRDYTLVLGMVIFFGVLIILSNLLMDLIYSGLNPRVDYERRGGG
ncbi:MAG: ABC transporter permease subunit [Alphaproteobacteria bacterium]|nr:ABC transporter permease subunit [Alphaproteobacteria bacterium]OJV45660.1 MAG: oligopeptide transporter permease [Alphaproteobacteria bacterium 43-37]